MSQSPSISNFRDVTVIMDWQHFREFTLGDEELEIEILSIFYNSVPEYITELKASGAASWPAACHKIKGTARIIGAWSLAHHCENAENMGSPKQDSSEREQVIVQIQNELNLLNTELLNEYDILLTMG